MAVSRELFSQVDTEPSLNDEIETMVLGLNKNGVGSLNQVAGWLSKAIKEGIKVGYNVELFEEPKETDTAEYLRNSIEVLTRSGYVIKDGKLITPELLRFNPQQFSRLVTLRAQYRLQQSRFVKAGIRYLLADQSDLERVAQRRVRNSQESVVGLTLTHYDHDEFTIRAMTQYQVDNFDRSFGRVLRLQELIENTSKFTAQRDRDWESIKRRLTV